jgi:hypothetical protein
MTAGATTRNGRCDPVVRLLGGVLVVMSTLAVRL